MEQIRVVGEDGRSFSVTGRAAVVILELVIRPELVSDLNRTARGVMRVSWGDSGTPRFVVEKHYPS